METNEGNSLEGTIYDDYGYVWTPFYTSYTSGQLKYNARMPETLKTPKKEKKVLVLYTGGTIGMMRGPSGAYEPIPNKLEDKLRINPHLHDMEYMNLHLKSKIPEPLVLPNTSEEYRVIYTVKENDPLLDSSNMTMDDWINIAKDIEKFYDKFDAFVILHGTDTLCYTASALSFMLENLDKPVIITGSQIPIFETRSDGQDNFLGALIIAGNYDVPEVAVFFNHRLFRGNRTAKVSTNDLRAFATPNMRPLATVGIDILVDKKAVLRPSKFTRFTVQKTLNRNVGLLRLYPSIPIEVVKAYLRPPMEGVVLETFGAGNIPSIRTDLQKQLKVATERGVIIVNITQCLQGSVSSEYETGMALVDLGVISGHDMTPEAALTKLCYVLSKKWSLDSKREMMLTNLRGEMTIEHKDKPEDYLNTGLSKKPDPNLNSCSNDATLFKYVAEGNLKRLHLFMHYVSKGGDINCHDLERRTPLHIAAAEGGPKIVRYLLHHGADVSRVDNHERTPLDYAIDVRDLEVVRILRKSGAKLNKSPTALGEALCSAASSGELLTLKAYRIAGANLAQKDSNGRTALHQAVLKQHEKCIDYLLDSGANPFVKDSLGFSAADIANQLGFEKVFEKLQSPVYLARIRTLDISDKTVLTD